MTAPITVSTSHTDPLAAYVTDHALAVEGPIREYYLVGPHETADEDQWRTEIGWPIFHTSLAGK
jgi:effector-binding domain-containing protein